MEKISLNGSGWLFKDFTNDDWRWRHSVEPDTLDHRWWREGSVPGSPQHDLFQLGVIPNPYFELNSLAVEWIPQRSWVYKRTFMAEERWLGQRVNLHFEGVDYEAHFYLNGKLLGSHVGMYTPIDFDLTHDLEYGKENLLAVVIEHAPDEQSQVGFTSKVRTHKSRMTYWWDFCPRVVHLGIWDDVSLEITGAVKLGELFARPTLADDFRKADVRVAVPFHSRQATTVRVETAIRIDGEVVAAQESMMTVPAGSSEAVHDYQIEQPRLWWPNGCGEQPLYELEARVLDAAEGEILSDAKQTRFGIRKLEWIQNEGGKADALPYVLVANGRKVYINGWNWVPVDVMYGVPRPEKTRRLLELARDAHVNLLRVWGGGLIEKQAFYDLCDELGILVWQEFIQSSSGIDNLPPTTPEMLEFLTREAELIIPRRRNHPSLALWCGGNELTDLDQTPLGDEHPNLAALKAVVERLDPDRFWLPTSPSGKEFSNGMETIESNPEGMHDVHGPWEYQGTRAQYDLYNHGQSLLHSEFGVEGITNRKTLDQVIAPEHQWPVFLDSNPYWQHAASWWVRRKVWDQVFGELPDVDTYVRATQFIQYDGLRYALEADRRRQFVNSGTLPWQFNEPFPMAACTSAVDYFAHPKPVYYAVEKAYEALHVSAKYETLCWSGMERFEAEVWGSNARLSALEGARLRARLVGIDGAVRAEWSETVSLGANGSAPLLSVAHPLAELPEQFFLVLELTSVEGELLSENHYLFTQSELLTPVLSAPAAKLAVEKVVDGNDWTLTLRNEGASAAYFVWIEDGRERGTDGFVFVDQNYLVLFPGEQRVITARWQDAPDSERVLEISGWNAGSIRI